MAKKKKNPTHYKIVPGGVGRCITERNKDSNNHMLLIRNDGATRNQKTSLKGLKKKKNLNQNSKSSENVL